MAIYPRTSRKGVDPAGNKETSANDFGAVATEWLRRDQSGNRSHDAVKRLLDKDVLPRWGHKPIVELTRRDALELIDGVADRGSPVMARRLHSHLHRLFRWAVGRGIIDANPMQSLPKVGSEISRDRVLSDAELKRVWAAAGEMGWPFGSVYQLLILTGARLREIGELRWVEIDGDKIKIGAERTKNGLPHTIPLSAPALDLVNSLQRIVGSEFVFTSTGRSPISGWSKAKRQLDKSAPIEPWHVHDLRRVVATGMQKLGVAERVIETCLGHSTTSRNSLLRVYQDRASQHDQRDFDKLVQESLHAWIVTCYSADLR